MDQRPDQLKAEGWNEDRSTRLPREDDELTIVEAVAFVDDPETDSETERIKAEIEDTRAEMGQTLNEIQERLSPEHVMGQVKETVREATIGKVERVMEKVNEKISNVTEPAMEMMGRAGEKLKETGSTLTNTVRQNPIPLALVGIGVGWFIVNRVRNADGRSRSYGDGRSRSYGSEREMGYGMATPRYAQSNRSAFSQVRNTANGLMSGTTETVSNLSHQAKEGAVRAGRGLQRMVSENPLAGVAVAVAAGAAVGLVLPSTRVEHEYMGEASGKILDKAQQVAREAMDKVKSATQADQPQGGQQQGGKSQQVGQGPGGKKQGIQPQISQGQAGQPQGSSEPEGRQGQAGQRQSGPPTPGQPTQTA